MLNSKNPHNKKQQKSIDGFVRSTPPVRRTNDAFEARFRTSYTPGTSAHNEPRNAHNTRTSTEELLTERSRSTIGFDTNRTIGTRFPAVATQTPAPSEHTKSRFGFLRRKKKKTGVFKKLARSFAVVLLALLIGVSSLFAYGYIKARNVFQGNGEGAAALQKDVDPARLNGEGDGRVNILLIGKGGEGHEAPDLTDTLLLASIDPVQNEAAMVSVPRDLYVKDLQKSGTKINAVYATAKQARLAKSNKNSDDAQAAENAGLSAIKTVVSEVLGVPIHYYVMIDFKAFEEAINTVGGITVDVKEPLYDATVAWQLGGNPLVAGEGLQTFDGKRALLYARSRKGSARGDFDRAERQQEIIIALQKKVLTLGTFSNPIKIVELLGNLGSHVRTDLNGTDEIKRLYEIGQKISEDKIARIGLADPSNILVTTDMVGDQSVVVPLEGMYKYDDIQSYIRNTLRDAFLKSEDARIVLMNGTTVAGFATARSKELKSYGYNVVSVANAPTATYVQSVLIDNTAGQKKYTKSYLEKRMELTASTQAIPGIPGIDTADFVIILGTDETTQNSN